MRVFSFFLSAVAVIGELTHRRIDSGLKSKCEAQDQNSCNSHSNCQWNPKETRCEFRNCYNVEVSSGTLSKVKQFFTRDHCHTRFGCRDFDGKCISRLCSELSPNECENHYGCALANDNETCYVDIAITDDIQPYNWDAMVALQKKNNIRRKNERNGVDPSTLIDDAGDDNDPAGEVPKSEKELYKLYARLCDNRRLRIEEENIKEKIAKEFDTKYTKTPLQTFELELPYEDFKKRMKQFNTWKLTDEQLKKLKK